MKYLIIITFSFACYHKVFGNINIVICFLEISPGEWFLFCIEIEICSTRLGRPFHIREPVLANDFFHFLRLRVLNIVMLLFDSVL